MKRLLFISFLFIFCSTIQSQEIKFMGQDLTRTNVSTLCNVLKKKGLKLTKDGLSEKEFQGTFATYPNCKISVSSTEVTKRIKTIEVVFESVRNNESEMIRTFSEIVKQYQNKYHNKVVKMEEDKASRLINFFKYTVSDDIIKIHIQRVGPSILSETCSMSIVYENLMEKNNDEKNPKQYSSDI